MPRRTAIRPLVVLATIWLAVAACAGTAASVAPLASPTVARSDPSPSLDAPAPSLGEPPQVTLAAEGGDQVPGALGSFVWGDGGSDSPWLPGAPITVGSAEPLTVDVPPGIPVKDWKAERVPAGAVDGVGAIAVGGGTTTPIAFPAPGPGTWSTQVMLTFGDDLGSATYYWAVTVR